MDIFTPLEGIYPNARPLAEQLIAAAVARGAKVEEVRAALKLVESRLECGIRVLQAADVFDQVKTVKEDRQEFL